MIRRIAIIGLMVMGLCASGWAQQARLQELLAKLPVNGSAEGEKVMADLIALGPDALKELCGMLAPFKAGEGGQPAPDDTSAQLAVNGLSMYVCRPGAEDERKMFSGVLISALESAKDNEARAFLVRQLQLVGKDEAVAPLSALLADDRLCDPASQALVAIRTPAATAALVKALADAQGPRRVSIIRSLGDLRAKEAVTLLLKDAVSQDVNIRRTALWAVANIGDPSATDVLSKATQAASIYDRDQATSFYFLLAQRMAEAGNKEQCIAICRDLIKGRTAPRDRNVQCGALSVLTTALGREALGDLLGALDSPDKQIREAALALICRLPGEDITASCIEKMKQVGPETRVEIIAMLSRRGDRSALPTLVTATKDKEPAVRVAAIPAAARLGGTDALPALMAVFETDQADDINAAQQALLLLPGEEAMKAAAEALTKVSPTSRIALLQLLAGRRAKAQAEAVFAAATDKESSVRAEAIKTLGELVTETDLPRLIDLMLSTTDAGDQAAAQKAVASAARRIADPERRADSLLAALPKASPEQRALLLRTMAQVGGKKALESVLADAQAADPKLQDTATRALCEWQDVAAAPELLKVASTSTNQAHQVLALRGYVRLVDASSLPAEKKTSMLAEALSVAKRVEEKRLALSALANVKSMAALKTVGGFLDDETLREEAAIAVVKIACPKDKKDKGLTDPAARPIIEKALPLIKDENARRQAEEHLKTIPKDSKPAGNPARVSPPDLSNLARGKPVRASVPSQGDRTPYRAVDGNSADPSNSAWFGNKWPCTFEVDLQKSAKIEAAHVFFYWDGQRFYQYTLETSADGKAWKTVADMSKNEAPSTPKGVLHTFAPVEAQFVRLNILKNSANEAVHLVELKVYAEGTAPKPPAPPQPDAEGFIPLFNGKDLTGWVGSVTGYDVVDGVLVCDAKRGGYIRTEEEYGDFILRFEFKLTPGANNGLAIRAPASGNPAYAGMELQILDNTAERYKNLQPYQFHGSIYGVVPAKREFLKPVGEWNFQEVIAKGPRITVTLNGETIVDADVSKIETPMDHKEHPGLKRQKGYIGFMGHGSQVEFRNIRIKPLGAENQK